MPFGFFRKKREDILPPVTGPVSIRTKIIKRATAFNFSPGEINITKVEKAINTANSMGLNSKEIQIYNSVISIG